jgi:hypothetical protein
MTDKLIKTGDYVVALTNGGYADTTLFIPGNTYKVTSGQGGEGQGVLCEAANGVSLFMYRHEVKPVEEFQVGDTVEVITDRFGRHQRGRVGEVERIDGPIADLPIRVRFNNHYNVYHPRDLKLVGRATASIETPAPTEKGNFVVARIHPTKGYPQFAQKPVLHTSRALAEAEMVRLTNLYRGTYRVFQAVAEATKPEPVEPKLTTKKLD